MIYKVTGTREQFDILSEKLDDYIRLNTFGHLGCLLVSCRTALYKRADKTKLKNREWIISINKVVGSIIEEMRHDIKELGKTDETAEWEYRHVKTNSMLCQLRTILDTDIIYADNAKTKDTLSFEFDSKELSKLSTICNDMARMICGQPFSMKDALTSAWYNISPRNKDADDILSHKLDAYLSMLHTLCWHSADNELDGVHYDENSDSLFDMYQVFRHVLWEDAPDDKKSQYTVDADMPIQYSKFDLVRVERIIDK